MNILFDHEIKEFLENVPLYVWQEYDVSAVNRSDLFHNGWYKISVWSGAISYVRPQAEAVLQRDTRDWNC